MAHYDVHRNRGYDGYGIKEPTYGAIVGYSATSESYVASSKEVVSYGGYPVRPDLRDQIGWPRSSTHIQPKKGDEHSHSPRFSHTNGSPHDSPRKTLLRANSPPKGDYSSKYGPHLGSPHDSPRKNFRDNRGGFSSNDDDSSDDDVECRDGVCYPKPKYGGGGGGGQGYEYDKEKKKPNGNGYAAGNYPLMHSTDHQPRKDPYHQASDGPKYYNTEKLPEGNNIYGSHSYNAPAHTKPTTGAYYEADPYVVPAPIKTRPDRPATAHWTPSSPKRGNWGRPEKIDSTEAQRRYGNAPPQSGPPADRWYEAAIDGATAARKYGGVFVK